MWCFFNSAGFGESYSGILAVCCSFEKSVVVVSYLRILPHALPDILPSFLSVCMIKSRMLDSLIGKGMDEL
jgi:hypothetical protein